MISKHRWAAAVALTAVIGLSACNPAAQRSEEPASSQGATFTKDLSGTLKISGFNPSDEVGQSRADYAGQLQGVTVELDTTNFDAQKFPPRSPRATCLTCCRWIAASSPRWPTRS